MAQWLCESDELAVSLNCGSAIGIGYSESASVETSECPAKSGNDDLAAQINFVGDAIRDLKTNDGSVGEITSKVEELQVSWKSR